MDIVNTLNGLGSVVVLENNARSSISVTRTNDLKEWIVVSYAQQELASLVTIHDDNKSYSRCVKVDGL